MEPILTEVTRAIRIPSRYQAAFECLCQLQRQRWLHTEIDWEKDREEWRSLAEPEKRAVRRILEFFMGFDALVNDNIDANFKAAVRIAEFKALWQEQETSEVTHQLTYSTAAHVFFPDAVAEIEYAIDAVPSVRAMADWARGLAAADGPEGPARFLRSLVGFALVEGIMFCAPFAVIYWFRQRGQLPGLTHSNDLIAQDELTHVQIAQMVFKTYVVHKEALPVAAVHAMVREAVALEQAFVRDVLAVDLIGLRAVDMCAYVEFVADSVLRGFGMPQLYGTSLPPLMNYMQRGYLESKTNFFEKRVPEYTTPVGGAADDDRDYTDF
jgi:ribonucleoside-diphosphate reductase beta chain